MTESAAPRRSDTTRGVILAAARERCASDGYERATIRARAAMTNKAAATWVQQIFAGQLAPQVAAVCPDPAQAGTRTTLVAAQLFGFGLCRYVLRLPPALHMPPNEVITPGSA